MNWCALDSRQVSLIIVGSTQFYQILPWLYLALLHSTRHQHGSTWLYSILLDSTTALLGSTQFYQTLPWLYLTLLDFSHSSLRLNTNALHNHACYIAPCIQPYLVVKLLEQIIYPISVDLPRFTCAADITGCHCQAVHQLPACACVYVCVCTCIHSFQILASTLSYSLCEATQHVTGVHDYRVHNSNGTEPK